LVIAHAQKAQLPVSSIPTAVAQFRSASQFIPLALPQSTPLHQHQLHTSGLTQPRHHHVFQRLTALIIVMIIRVTSDHTVIAGHQLSAHTASAMSMVQASAQRLSAHQPRSALPARPQLSRRLLMVVAMLSSVFQTIAIAHRSLASSHHQHASTTRIALPLDTMTAAAHTHVSATSHSAARSSLLHAQRVTSGQSSRLTSVVQLPDALSVHQTTPPRHTLHQLSLQPSMFTPQQHQLSSPTQSPAVLVTPRTVRLSTTVRSGRLMLARLAAVLLSSQLSAQRLSALLQLHVQRARSRPVPTRSTSAAQQSAAHQTRTARSANMSSAQRLPSQHVSATRT
jgi:hypothetical protein